VDGVHGGARCGDSRARKKSAKRNRPGRNSVARGVDTGREKEGARGALNITGRERGESVHKYLEPTGSKNLPFNETHGGEA